MNCGEIEQWIKDPVLLSIHVGWVPDQALLFYAKRSRFGQARKHLRERWEKSPACQTGRAIELIEYMCSHDAELDVPPGDPIRRPVPGNGDKFIASLKDRTKREEGLEMSETTDKIAEAGKSAIEVLKADIKMGVVIMAADKAVEYSRLPIAQKLAAMLGSTSEEDVLRVLTSPLGEGVHRFVMGTLIQMAPLGEHKQALATVGSHLRAQSFSKVLGEITDIVIAPAVKALLQSTAEMKQLDGIEEVE